MVAPAFALSALFRDVELDPVSIWALLFYFIFKKISQVGTTSFPWK